MDFRPIDPTRVLVRHVSRTASGGRQVAGVRFAAQDEVGVNGRQGWQRAIATAVLSDEGEVEITFPNVAGGDGILHRKRFAILTDDDYRPGEEWLEVRRDADEAVAVVTPHQYDVSTQEIVLRCYDVAGYLNRFRGTEVDVWTGHAPRDVFEHYTRLPYLGTGRNLRAGWTINAPTGAGGPDAAGWDAQRVSATNGEAAFDVPAAAQAFVRRGSLSVAGDYWMAHARLRITQNPAAGDTQLGLEVRTSAGGTLIAALRVTPGRDAHAQRPGYSLVAHGGGLRGEVAVVDGLATTPLPGTIDLRIIARYDRLWFFVNGELMTTTRRSTTYATIGAVSTYATAGTAGATNLRGAFETLYLLGSAPFALRGATKGDYHLPGQPTPGGLRASYYNEAPAASQFGTGDAAFLPEVLNPRRDPSTNRLEATVDLASGFTPPGLPGAWSARIMGAIYLDLAASDYAVRISGGSPATAARVYVGRTMPGQAVVDRWATSGGSLSSPNSLRFTLPSKAGWYPIVIELAQPASALSAPIQLQIAPGPAFNVWTTVPTTALSPYGCFAEDVRLETHRAMLDAIAEQFGYQWIAEPRVLESGEFPGAIIPRVRQGTDRNVTIDRVGTDVRVSGDAGDAVDQMIFDAAGIADPNGSGQVTADVIDFDSAGAHLGIVTDYDSLAEITETEMLEQRARSILALRASPNEQIGVRPPGQQDLVDTIPLTGQLAKMRWTPGDGVMLAQPAVGVVDRSPRQIVRVARPLTPDGVGIPEVTYRQRPRGAAAVLRRALRAAVVPQRNYQGQLLTIDGTIQFSSDGPPWTHSYLVVPPDGAFERIVRLFWITSFSSGSGWTLVVSTLSTGVNVSQVGTYDVTRWLPRNPGSGYFWGRGEGGTGAIYGRLRALVIA